jgi:hypothetical protein
VVDEGPPTSRIDSLVVVVACVVEDNLPTSRIDSLVVVVAGVKMK